MLSFGIALAATLPLLVSCDRLEHFPITEFSEEAIARRLVEKARDIVSSSSSVGASWDALPTELRVHITDAVQDHAAKLYSEFAVVRGDSLATAHAGSAAESAGHAPFVTAAERHQELQRLLARAEAERSGAMPRMADSATAFGGMPVVGGLGLAGAAAGAPAVSRGQPIPIPAELSASLPLAGRRRNLMSDLAAAPPRAPSGFGSASPAFDVSDVEPFHNPGASAADGRADVVNHGGVSVRRIPPGTIKTFEVKTTSSVMATAATDTTPADGGVVSPARRRRAAAADAAAGAAPGVEVAAGMELPPGRGHIVVHDALVQQYVPRDGRGLGPLAAGLADASERRLQAAAAAVRFPLSDPRHNIPPPPMHAPDEVPPAAAAAAARNAAAAAAAAGAASGFEASAHAARRLSPLAAARRALPWTDTGVRMDAAELAARLQASAPAGPASATGAAPAAPLVASEPEAQAAADAEADAARFLMLTDRGAGAAAGGAVLHAASEATAPGPAAAFNGLYDASTGLSEPTKDCKKNVNTWLGKCVFTGSISGSAAASSGGAGQAMSKDCAKTLNTWLSSCVFKAK